MPEVTDDEIITRFGADFEGTDAMDEKNMVFAGQEFSPTDLIRHMRQKTGIGIAWLNALRKTMGEDLLQASKIDS